MSKEKMPELPGKPAAPAIKEPSSTTRQAEIAKPKAEGKDPSTEAAGGDTHSQDADRKRHQRHVVSDK